MLTAVTDYLHGIDIHISKPVSVTKLGNGDLFHYGWNIWNHFKPVKKNKQEDIGKANAPFNSERRVYCYAFDFARITLYPMTLPMTITAPTSAMEPTGSP